MPVIQNATGVQDQRVALVGDFFRRRKLSHGNELAQAAGE